MNDYQHGLLKGRTPEELVDALARGGAEPQSPVGVAMQSAILAGLVERAATPRRWTLVAITAAVLSALATVANAILIAVK
jgi:hypothetical protein